MIAVKNYFQFEEDFVENNVRCIPMSVRFKLDACGIKLKLAEWSRLNVTERENLANFSCEAPDEIAQYRQYLKQLVFTHTGNHATDLPVMQNPTWGLLDEIPYPLQEKLNEFKWSVSLQQWKSLSDLQRFALLKLSYPGHENKNFPKAMMEFGLGTGF
jgi:hypothetical protein